MLPRPYPDFLRCPAMVGQSHPAEPQVPKRQVGLSHVTYPAAERRGASSFAPQS